MTDAGLVPPTIGGRPADYVDQAWMMKAAEIEARYPGWTVRYGMFGFTARRDDVEVQAGSVSAVDAAIRSRQPADQPAAADPMDLARDEIARGIEAAHPGWKVGHDLYGWAATRQRDSKTVRAQSSQGLTALLPFGD
jgi:hypothetical protein